jgi:hypothetical protein
VTLKIGGVVTGFKYQGTNFLMSSTNWFLAAIDEERVFIRTGAPGSKEVAYHEYSDLNGNSYALTAFNTNFLVSEYVEIHGGVAKHFKLENPIKPTNEAMVFLNEGAVPEAGLGFLTPVWLAYGFHGQNKKGVSGKGRHTPLFAVAPDFRELGGQTEIEYAFNAQPPKCLTILRETFSAKDLHRLGLQTTLKGQYTNSTYEVNTWTNIGGWVLPLSFNAVHLLHGTATRRSSYEIIIYHGEATNIESCQAVPRFVVPQVTRVVERRAEYVRPNVQYSYTSTDGRLWTPQEVRTKAQVDGRVHRGASNKRWIVYLTFGFALIGPPVVVLGRRFLRLSKQKLALS